MTPKFRVLAYDPATNYQLRRHHLAVADRVRFLVGRDRGTTTGLPLGGGFTAAEIIESFKEQRSFKYLSPHLSYIEFGSQKVAQTERGTTGGNEIGDSGACGGFRITPSVFPQHLVCNRSSADPTGATGFPVMEFEQVLPALAKNLGKFETVLPDGATTTALYYNSQTPGRVTQARSKNRLPRNAQWEIELAFVALAEGHPDTGGFRIGFGEGLSLVGREGAEVSLERKHGALNIPIGRIENTL